MSSTFRDLQEERQEVMQALLELDCIPSGMELFPAANEDQWTLIKRVIDDCDYYIVIIGGRYGSVASDGISYTEMEYRYALERAKPTIGFLHKTPGAISVDRSETDPRSREKLDSFRALVQQKVCRYWDGAADLGSQVSRSLVKLIKTSPAIGWVRADHIGENVSAEILRLRKRIEELEAGIEAARETAPAGTEALAQGDEVFLIHFTFSVGSSDPIAFMVDERDTSEFAASWNDIFSALAPLMIDEASEPHLRAAISNFASERNIVHLRKLTARSGHNVSDFSVVERDFQTIKVQLRALGLISKSARARSVKDTDTYWALTPYGDAVMTRLRAIRRSSESPTAKKTMGPATKRRRTS